MDVHEQALSLLSTAQREKREYRAKQRNARVLMEAFYQLCRREGIDPAEIHKMQDSRRR